MTRKLILKVKKFQLSIAKSFVTVEEKPQGGGFHTPPPPHTIKSQNFSQMLRVRKA